MGFWEEKFDNFVYLETTLSLYPVFTKLDMINNQLVLTNPIWWNHDDATVDRFRLEFCILWACEHNNLISSHPIFTKLSMTNHQIVFSNISNDDISDITIQWFWLKVTSIQLVSTVGWMIGVQGRTHLHDIMMMSRFRAFRKVQPVWACVHNFSAVSQRKM